MIGNDVVDMAAAKVQSNWQRKGFLQKLFSMEEQQVILQYHEPETMVWVLWSMKEAAYKIYNRETGVRAYIPHKLHCIITVSETDYFEGKVFCEGFEYPCQSTIAGEAVHTVALKEPALKFHEPKNPEILKDTSGIPYIRKENALHPVSVSHHGSYHKVVSLL